MFKTDACSFGAYQETVAKLSKAVSDPVFLKWLNERDELYAKIREIEDSLPKPATKVEVREQSLRLRPMYESLAEINKRISERKAEHAVMAQTASTLRQFDERNKGTFLTYVSDGFNNLVSLGYFPSNSDNWLDLRRKGIGGSDVSAIMKVDEKYAAAELREVFRDKIGLVSSDSNNSDENDFDTVTGRGHVWEEMIRYIFADKHPELNVAYCKESWAVKDKLYRHANFDGLILDDKGAPIGILEIKTGINTDKWGPSGDIFNAPENYRKQIFWYAMNADLKFGYLAAVIDDHDYLEYYFDSSDPRVVAEMKEIEAVTDDFWAKVETEKALIESGTSNLLRSRKGFAKQPNLKQVANFVCLYTEKNFDEVYAKLRQGVKTIKRNNGVYDAKAFNDLVVSLLTDFDPTTRKRPFIGIDIETNHTSAKRGRIIETGVVTLFADKVTEVADVLHGVDDNVINGLGAGESQVHRITLDMLDGKESFSQWAKEADLLELLKSGTMVAHNGAFEDRWLCVNLDGYAEARDNGEIELLDTRVITTLFMLETPDNSLKSFTEFNGVPYVGSHCAAQDALIMIEALRNFSNSLYREKRVTYCKASDDEREAALLNVKR